MEEKEEGPTPTSLAHAHSPNVLFCLLGLLFFLHFGPHGISPSVPSQLSIVIRKPTEVTPVHPQLLIIICKPSRAAPVCLLPMTNRIGHQKGY